MNIKETKSNLALAIIHAKAAKQAIEFATQEGRQLLQEEELRQLKDAVLILGNDAATMDSFLGTYGRMSASSKRFASVK